MDCVCCVSALCAVFHNRDLVRLGHIEAPPSTRHRGNVYESTWRKNLEIALGGFVGLTSDLNSGK